MKRVFFVALAMMLGVIAHAQVELKPAFVLTFADLSEDPDTGKAKAQAGYQVGASVLFGKKFYFDPGVFYVKKSTQLVDQGADTDDINFNLTGLKFPVTVGFLLGNEENIVDLRIMGGGSVFFVTNVDSLDAEKSDFTSPSWGVYAGLVSISGFFSLM